MTETLWATPFGALFEIEIGRETIYELTLNESWQGGLDRWLLKDLNA